ncbi:MAG: hypothetical protein JWQ74_3560 [Marmoricola sp.]|nr:hypothetical protein [Marmoricola sp.]
MTHNAEALRIKASVSRMIWALDASLEIKHIKAAIKLSITESLQEYAQIINDEGGDGSYLNRSLDSINDDLDDAFQGVIDRTDADEEASHCPMEREMSRADNVYAINRDREVAL